MATQIQSPTGSEPKAPSEALDAQVRRRLIGTWTALFVLFTAGVLVWFFLMR